MGSSDYPAAVIKPPMAKTANVFGRLEAFSISVFLYVIGYIQMAGSNNVKTFASAQIFYSAGSTGLQILIQIFVADTSDLLNRALFSSLPDVPFLITVWVGPPIANSVLAHTTWRWGYGLWTIVLPAAFMPLALALFLNMRKAARLHLLPPSLWCVHFGVISSGLIANLRSHGGKLRFTCHLLGACSRRLSCGFGETPCYGGDRKTVLPKITSFLGFLPRRPTLTPKCA